MSRFAAENPDSPELWGGERESADQCVCEYAVGGSSCACPESVPYDGAVCGKCRRGEHSLIRVAV